MARWYFGTMGFGYADWNGVFYPSGMKPAEYLAFYAQHFDSVELDTTFYATPEVARVKHWTASVPAHFRFSLKTPRAITHEGSLDRNIPLMRDFIDAARHFESKLGVVLIQFPPSFAANKAGKLRTFLSALPRDLRFAVEFRHASWFDQQTFALLKEFRVAWVAAEYAATPRAVQLTADFLYVRLIGEHNRFDKLNMERIDVTDRLLWWKDELQANDPHIKSIWTYVNNDYSGYAIPTCQRLMQMLGISPSTPGPPKERSLFD